MLHSNETTNVVRYAIFSACLCFLIAATAAAIINGAMLLICLYPIGLIFGIFITIGITSTNTIERFSAFFLILLSLIIYIGYLLLFVSRDIHFNLGLRRVSGSGIAAAVFLLAVQSVFKISFTFFDFALVFSLGVLSTYFIWEDNFEIFDPWFAYLGVAVWQITIAYIIQRRINDSQIIQQHNYGEQ